MSRETVCRLIEYEIWCNQRAIAFLSDLPDEECKRDFGFGWRTPHRTVFHILDVMRGWTGCVGPEITRPAWRQYDESASFSWFAEELNRVGDSLTSAARASDQLGLLDRDRRLEHVFHIITHGTHHRGQLLSMITLMGHAQPFEGGDFGGWTQ